MIFPKKLTAAQLQADYKAPTKQDGVRTTSEGGQLQTTPSFTTSAKANDARREARPDNTSNSIGYAHSVEGTQLQSNCRERQAPQPAPPMSRSYVPANPDLFNRPAMRLEENKQPQIINPGAKE